jgi:hypothetical protein
LLLTLPAVVQAEDYTYATNNGTITITGWYTGPGGDATIPSTINGLSVTAISEFWFDYHLNVTSVTIPRSVTNIQPWAFSICGTLMTITVDALNPAYSSGGGVLFDKAQTALVRFPNARAGNYTISNSVTNVWPQAFASSGISKVTIPDSVTIIGDGAFGSCHGLTDVTVGNSVCSIGPIVS